MYSNFSLRKICSLALQITHWWTHSFLFLSFFSHCCWTISLGYIPINGLGDLKLCTCSCYLVPNGPPERLYQWTPTTGVVLFNETFLHPTFPFIWLTRLFKNPCFLDQNLRIEDMFFFRVIINTRFLRLWEPSWSLRERGVPFRTEDNKNFQSAEIRKPKWSERSRKNYSC